MATVKTKQADNRGEYYTYLLDFETLVIATLAEQVTQQEAKRVAVETECDEEQMIVVSHDKWDWTQNQIELFSGINIRKTTAKTLGG